MMKRSLKIASVIVSLMLCISLCTINVFAEPDDNIDTTPSQPQVVTEPPATLPPTEPPTPAPTEPPTPAPTQPPATQAPATYAPATQAPATYAPATEAPYYSSNSSRSNTSTYSSNNSSYYSSKSSALSSPTKAPTAAVYDVEDRKVDTNTLKKKDWDKIAERLKNADVSDDGAGDFDFIKKNDGNGDNGAWILYTGIALEVVGVAIIIALIVLAAKKRKKLRNGHGDDRRNPPRGGNQPPRRTSPPQRAPQRAQQPATKRQVKKRSKFDTAEVYIPKNATQRGGRRYKPKH